MTQGGPNFETYYLASMGPVKNVNFSQVRGALKNAIFVMAKDLIGLDILPRMTVMRPDFGLRFFLGPLLHTTLVNDIREKSKLKLKSV